MSRETDVVVIRTIGIDTGKNTLHLVGLDDQRTIVLREKLAAGRIGVRLANVPPCLIGIEAGMGTHYAAPELLALGREAGATGLCQAVSTNPQERLPRRLRESRKACDDNRHAACR